MKTARKRVTAKDVSGGNSVINETKKTKTRTAREPLKARGKPSRLPGGAKYSIVQGKSTCLLEAKADMPSPHLNSGQSLQPSTKMKLQLFPIDEGTRMGLEKDGLHPYLELTLSAKKKVSSVLRHIESKWGSSSIAVGEPLLFPYDLAMGAHRWTVNDTSISARDVYTTIGRPAVFRLRYGWGSDFETKATELPSISASFEGCFGSENVQRECNDSMGTAFGNSEKVETRNEENAETDMTSVATDAVVNEKMFSDLAVNSTDNEAMMDGDIGQPLSLWDCSISVGGLLSEASMQGNFRNTDSKSDGLIAGVQPSQSFSDSFFAFPPGQTNHSEAPRPSNHAPSSSFFNADDTCHAFEFQKYFSSAKDAMVAGSLSTCPQTYSQDTNSKPFKFPNLTESNPPIELPESQTCQGTETDLPVYPRLYNDESSLGLSDIKWTETLGAFDLGMASTRRTSNGTAN